MKTLLLLITPALLTALSVSGQVITNVVPQAGDAALLATEYPLSESGPSGTDVVWDFSEVHFTAQTVYTVVDADEAPSNDLYPGASHAIAIPIHEGLTMYNFHDFTEGEWAEYGSYSLYEEEGMQNIMLFDGPRIPFTVPLTPASSGASEYEATLLFSGFEFVTGWTYSWEVDASGTLILPNATYEDVLRVKGVAVSDGAISEENTEYIWVKDGIPFPLLSLVITVQDFGTGPTVYTSAGALVSFLPTDLEDADRERFHTSVYPNPVGDALQFRTAEGFGSTASVTVIDALGRVVLQGGEMSTAAMETGILNVQNLLPGLYILRIQGAGTVSETRFVKR